MTEQLHTSEAQRQLVAAWLTANGITLKGVPIRDTIEIITTGDNRLIRYATFVRVRGELLIGVREIHEVPVTVELTDVALPEPADSADEGGNSE